MKEFIAFFRFFYRLKKWELFSLLFLMVCAGVFEAIGLSMFIPILEGASNQSVIGGRMESVFKLFKLEYSFTVVVQIMIILFFLRSLFVILKESYIIRVIVRFLIDLRFTITQALFQADYQYFLQKKIGYINNAITAEFQRLAFAFKMFASVLSTMVFATIYFLPPLFLKPDMTLLLCAIGLPALLVVRYTNHLTKEFSIGYSRESAHLNTLLIQALNHFKYLKATHTYGNFLKKINETSNQLGKFLFRHGILEAISNNAFIPFVILVASCILWYQVKVADRQITQVAFFLLLLARAATEILLVQQRYRKFLESFGSLAVYQQFNDELVRNVENLKRKGLASDFSKPLQFKNVSFSYNNNVVLKNINLTIAPKSSVAFVGTSGVGKTTLVTLLTGILAPTSGMIILGDKNYVELDQRLLRKNIGYVTQESVIFNDTIKNNIILWSEEDLEERVALAVQKAHLQEFIEHSSDRYDTLLGESGMKISGGQRQRLSIAREIFKDTKMLIFDEATSALDTHVERQIQKNIEELKKDRTIVVVAHRISTVKNCDQIFVLKNGMIVEKGSYDELYNLNGEFRRMADMQALATTKETASQEHNSSK